MHVVINMYFDINEEYKKNKRNRTQSNIKKKMR